MRRVAVRLFAIGLLGLAAAQFHTAAAQACIKFDRTAEKALIDEGIASAKTSEANKAVLRAIRKEILFFRDKKRVNGEDILQHHYLTTEALKLLGKERIVWQAPEGVDPSQWTKRVKGRMAAAGAPPSC